MSYKFTGTQTNRFYNGNFTSQPTEYTIAGWVRPASTGNRCIVVRSSGNPGSAWSHELRHNTAFLHYLYDGSAKTVFSSTTIVLNTLYHVAATAKNGGNMKLYINGISEGTPVAVSSMYNGGNDFWVGATDGEGYIPFEGELSELCIWYKELSATEILKLATGKVRYLPQTIQPEFLYLYLPMNDGNDLSSKTTDWKDLNTKSILSQTRANNVTLFADQISYP